MEYAEKKASRYFLSRGALKDNYNDYFNEKEKSWDIFVLINRKGYWDYKILFPNGVSDKKERIIISDRYLEKTPLERLKKLMNKKSLVVYDDSLTNGSNLFYYFMLCKSADAAEVVPVVYALNIGFPNERSYKLMRREAGRISDKAFWAKNTVEDLIKEFEGKIRHKILLNDCDIDRLSQWQTQLFQETVSPLVMDLPIINCVSTDEKEKKTGHILLPYRQFAKLCDSPNENWQYIENEMRRSAKPVKASYFRYWDSLLEQIFPNLFHDFVVKCKYEKVGDCVKVVFTPFAIAKSITFQNAEKLFRLFYEDNREKEDSSYKEDKREKEDNSYGKEILDDLDDLHKCEKVDGNLEKAMFRAIIYRLSHYVGIKFQRYVKKLLGLELEYDWEIMYDNFDDTFINSEEEWYRTFDEDSFRKQIQQFKDDESIEPIAVKPAADSDREAATLEKVQNYILDRVNEKKREIDLTLKQRIYTLETIEFELDARFCFKDREERRQMITSTCLAFLETNMFGNYILVDSGKQVMFRGFRYGENSEIFLHESLWFFYAYLYAFYNSISGYVKDGYDAFMVWLEGFWKKRGYMGLWITEEGFRFLRGYFGRMGAEELEHEIMRRRYLLEDNGYGENIIGRKDMIREAMYVIKQRGEGATEDEEAYQEAYQS